MENENPMVPKSIPGLQDFDRGFFSAIVNSHVPALANQLGFPTELVTRFSALLGTSTYISGKVSYIDEDDHHVEKWVTDADGKNQIFTFPTTEQLDKDAASSDPNVSAKAKKLKRFEKRFDDALNHRLKITVFYTQSGSGSDFPVPADQITSVAVSPGSSSSARWL